MQEKAENFLCGNVVGLKSSQALYKISFHALLPHTTGHEHWIGLARVALPKGGFTAKALWAACPPPPKGPAHGHWQKLSRPHAQDKKAAPMVLLGLIGCGIILPLIAVSWHMLSSTKFSGPNGIMQETLAFYYHSKFSVKESQVRGRREGGRGQRLEGEAGRSHRRSAGIREGRQ